MTSSVAVPIPGRPRGRPVSSCALLAAALVATVAGLLAVSAAPAGAHAAVRSTTPFDGERLAPTDVPSQVTIEFNEPVSAPPDAIRVFDDDGERVDVDGPVEGDGASTVARPLGPLDDGGYVVTWSVVSEDGHPLRGAFVFTVGEGAGPSSSLVTEVFGGGAGAVGPAQIATAGVTYVAVLLAAGAVLTGVALRRPPGPRAGRWITIAAVVGVAATLLVVPLQAVAAAADGIGAAFDPAQLADVLGSSVGLAALVRVVGLAALIAARGRWRVAGAGVALASFLVDGHTRTVEPTALVVAADTLHLAAGAVWFGGLVLLLQRLRERRLADDPVGGAALVRDWSRLATVAVISVVVAGSALSWATVRDLDALSTGYGTTLVVKVGLALLLVAIGAYNHWRVVPAVQRAVVPVPAGAATSTPATATEHADDERAGATVRTEAGWRRLGATVRFEVVLLVAVLAVTGWLQGQRPAAEQLGIGGTFLSSEQLTEDLTLDVIVDPNVAGTNTIHLYLLDDTGRTVSAVEGVTLELSLPERGIAPIERTAQVAGPGHWTLTGRELALPGTWEIRATVRLDEFTEATVTVRAAVAAP